MSLGFAACALWACGNSEDGESTRGLPLSELPAEYARAACTAYQGCVGEIAALFGTTLEDCVETQTIAIEEELGEIEAAVAAGRVKYACNNVDACLDDIAARDCAGLLERESAACLAALDGTLDVGEDCSLNAECAGEAYCDFAEQCPGTCKALEPGGGTCERDDQCASGLVCFDDTGRCVAPARSGESCEQGEPVCAPGLLCLGANAANAAPGTCSTIEQAFTAELEEPCDLNRVWCKPGTVCEVQAVLPALEAECAAKVASGAACRVAAPDQCPDDEYCAVGALSLDGTCTPKPRAGQACAAPSYARETPSICAAPLVCESGICRELGHLGETCDVDESCFSGTCRAGACVAGGSCD
jgi:hypothetical protein